MDRDNHGALVNRMKVWASQLWLNLLNNLMIVTIRAERTLNKVNSESARSSHPTIEKDNEDFMANFEVGNLVKFIDLLGHDEKAWGMDRIEFKILQDYLGKTGRIIDTIVMEDVPYPYNMFLTVQFKDGYTIYDANLHAFGPPEYKVLDFMKAKERFNKEAQENE